MTVFDILEKVIGHFLDSGQWYDSFFVILFFGTAIMWLFLPIAIFGIKGKLDEVKKELEKIRKGER